MSERMARRHKTETGCPEEKPCSGKMKHWDEACWVWSPETHSCGRPSRSLSACSTEPNAQIPSSKLIMFTSSCLKWPCEFIKIVQIHLVIEHLWAPVSSKTTRPKCRAWSLPCTQPWTAWKGCRIRLSGLRLPPARWWPTCLHPQTALLSEAPGWSSPVTAGHLH